MRLATPELHANKYVIKKWVLANEERMLEALERWGKFGGMTMRIKFELRDARDGMFHTFQGKRVVIRKIPTQGKFVSIVNRLIEVAIEEARK